MADYGSGSFQGVNVAWIMGQTGTPSPLPLGVGQDVKSGLNLLAGSSSRATYRTPLGPGSSPAPVPKISFKTALNGRQARALRPRQVMRNPMDRSQSLSKASRGGARNMDLKNIPAVRAPKMTGAGSMGRADIAALTLTQELFLTTVTDTAWEIGGTGDFNGDQKTDILWRYYGTSGPYLGANVVWHMNGTAILSEAFLTFVTATDWKIAGTADFDGDQKIDILWRYYGASGRFWGRVLFGSLTGLRFRRSVSDHSNRHELGQIAGIGDFNGDQKTDILWRNYGTGPYQGANVVWCMNGNAIVSEVFLTTVTDTAWEIGGTGDFNGDGKTDILWRYYGTSGPYLGANVIWEMNGTAISNEEFLIFVTDTNWRIVNH